MWKDVEGYPNIQAHSDGRVRVLPYNRLLTDWRRSYYKHYEGRELTISVKGKYPRVTIPDLRKDAPSYQRSIGVHVLVATAHCPKKPHHYLVRHKDGNVLNWKAVNLAWGTQKDNEKDKLLHGRNLAGERHHQSKLTNEQAAAIRKRYKAKCRTNGATAIAREYGVHRTTIENIVAGRTFV